MTGTDIAAETAEVVQHSNRLAREKSPYLLQHAHNPVDWFAWGEEAFAKARKENKPIFLSIGYSTCHWCHVMAHESFEHSATAEIMNREFVNIKVDREERPDVDRVYMTFVQATTGGGGWPMSVWLTPDLQPFVGGTYFPPEDRYGQPGFPKVLERIAATWKQDHAKIAEQGAKIIAALQEAGSASGGSTAPLSMQKSWMPHINNCRGRTIRMKAVSALRRNFRDQPRSIFCFAFTRETAANLQAANSLSK